MYILIAAFKKWLSALTTYSPTRFHRYLLTSSMIDQPLTLIYLLEHLYSFRNNLRTWVLRTVASKYTLHGVPTRTLKSYSSAELSPLPL